MNILTPVSPDRLRKQCGLDAPEWSKDPITMTDEELKRVFDVAHRATWQPANLAVMGAFMSIMMLVIMVGLAGFAIEDRDAVMTVASVTGGVIAAYMFVASITYMVVVNSPARIMWNLTYHEMQCREL